VATNLRRDNQRKEVAKGRHCPFPTERRKYVFHSGNLSGIFMPEKCWGAAMFRTGVGPYRAVSDRELRPIFYLVPVTGDAFMFSVTAKPPPGTEQPVVTRLLRAMLYVLVSSNSQQQALVREIERELPDRNDIAIKAKLMSLVRLVRERPWAYPALVDTYRCHQYHSAMKGVANASDTPAKVGADPVSGLGIGALLKSVPHIAFGLGLTNYFGGKSKDYYDFYARRIADELALRGIAPSTL
jgi:hypothetical protein